MGDFRTIQSSFLKDLGPTQAELYKWVNTRPEQENDQEILLRRALIKLSNSETKFGDGKRNGFTTGYIAVYALDTGVPIEHVKAIVGVMS